MKVSHSVVAVGTVCVCVCVCVEGGGEREREGGIKHNMNLISAVSLI